MSLGTSLDVLLDCGTSGGLVLSGGPLGQAVHPIPSLQPGYNPLQFVLTIDTRNPLQPLDICVKGVTTAALVYVPLSLSQNITGNDDILSNGITVGPRATDIPAVRATIYALDLITTTTTTTNTVLYDPLCDMTDLVPGMIQNSLPIVSTAAEAGPWMSWVGQEVSLTAEATDIDEDEIALEMTVYGVPPAHCDATSCGNAVFLNRSAATVSVNAKLSFPLPGSYLIRFRASDGFGSISYKDSYINVYKKGDVRGVAPCCRSTAFVTAHNLGRPVDRTSYRTAFSQQMAANNLSWSLEYFTDGSDIEAERLFDYSILAPPMPEEPISTVACGDLRLAGAGSPEVYGLTWARAEVTGHNNKLTLIPEAYPWANTSEVDCQRHWSGWQDTYAGEYKRTNTANMTCSVGCTADGTRFLIEQTGMVDQYNQALIQLSYGTLSLSPTIEVLQEVQVEKEPLANGGSGFGYYDTPARQALAASTTARPWMYVILSPLAFHQPPKYRAWSDGISSGGASITKCYMSMYYGVHETGHRLGFRHGTLWKLNGDGSGAAFNPPVNPLGTSSNGISGGKMVKDDGYTQRLDAMSCCKSDYGMFHRTLAGWFRHSQRHVIGLDEISSPIPTQRTYILWPFDRSESRHQGTVSVALRRSPDEILLLGYRSASHWEDYTASASLFESRQNVRGVQVEYVRRDPVKGWTDRGLLDFNLLHGDWPDALPPKTGDLSRQTNFALLKEARSWYDDASKVLVTFAGLGPCDQQAAQSIHNYTIIDFYGFNGEWPGQEGYWKRNFSGYSEFECAHVTVSTSVDRPTPSDDDAILDVKLTVVDMYSFRSASTASSIDVQQSNQSVACIDVSSSSSAPAPPLLPLTVQWSNETIVSVVWKDNQNHTIQTHFQSELSGNDTVRVPPSWLPVMAHVLAADGRHTRIEMDYAPPSNSSTSNYDINVKYRYYLPLEWRDKAATLFALPPCAPPLMQNNQKDDFSVIYLISYAVGGAMVIFVAVFVIFGAMWWRRRRQQKRQHDEVEHVGKEDAKARRANTLDAARSDTATDSSMGGGGGRKGGQKTNGRA